MPVSSPIQGPAPTKILAVALVVAASGCSDAAPTTQWYLARDSAGTTIVENQHARWEGGGGWEVADSPAVVVGSLEGSPEYTLFGVRDAKRLADGRIVVANSGTGELRYFDSSGRFLTSAGGQGEGPGEFSTLTWLRPYRGDSLLAWDAGHWGGSIFDREGVFARSFTLRPPESGGAPVFGFEVLPNGEVLAKSDVSPRERASGLRREQDAYYRFSPVGTYLGDVGVFPGRDRFLQALGENGSGPRFESDPPFGRVPVTAVHRERLCLGLAEDYEIFCMGAQGDVELIIRRAVQPRPVTESDFEAYVQRRLSRIRTDAQKREWEPRIRALPVAEVMPPYDTLLVDPLANLWVREPPVGEKRTVFWSVFDSIGGFLGALELPAGLRITQVGEDFVLGIWQDEMDVQYVQLYPLVKPEGSR